MWLPTWACLGALGRGLCSLGHDEDFSVPALCQVSHFPTILHWPVWSTSVSRSRNIVSLPATLANCWTQSLPGNPCSYCFPMISNHISGTNIFKFLFSVKTLHSVLRSMVISQKLHYGSQDPPLCRPVIRVQFRVQHTENPKPVRICLHIFLFLSGRKWQDKCPKRESQASHGKTFVFSLFPLSSFLLQLILAIIRKRNPQIKLSIRSWVEWPIIWLGLKLKQ